MGYLEPDLFMKLYCDWLQARLATVSFRYVSLRLS
jgi:hypothetical protein